MDYTDSDAYVTDTGTGHRMHQDTAPVTTEVSADDMNMVIWSLMELIKQAGLGLSGVSFNPSVASSYQRLRDALNKTFKQVYSITESPFNAAGVGDDTTPIDAAAAAIQFPYVPAGTFVSSNAALESWRFWGPGTLVVAGSTMQLNSAPQTDSAKKSYRVTGFGAYENAVSMSVTLNSGSGQAINNTQVLGTNAQGLASLPYTSFDQVALYVAAKGATPTTTTAGSTTYTANSITAPEVATAHPRPGTFIFTNHSPTRYIGMVKSVAGTVATVDGWYAVGTGTASTPANGSSAKINPNGKIFGLNVVVGMGPDSTALSGMELDFSATSGNGSQAWGIDCVAIGSEQCYANFVGRGNRLASFVAFGNAGMGDGGQYGFLAQGGSVVGFEARDPTTYAYNVKINGVERWNVSQFGAVVGTTKHF